MSSYREIQQDIRIRHGLTVKTCWIAHVRELNGLNPQVAANRVSSLKVNNPCPEHLRPLIEESMRRLGVLK